MILFQRQIEEAVAKRAQFEERYAMIFSEFAQKWKNGQIPDQHSYAIDQDYWEWEAVITDEARLNEIILRGVLRG